MVKKDENQEQISEKYLKFASIAVISGKRIPSAVVQFVSELDRAYEPGDNLELIVAAAHAGCSTPLNALNWAREVKREILNNAAAKKRYIERENARQQAELAGKEPTKRIPKALKEETP